MNAAAPEPRPPAVPDGLVALAPGEITPESIHEAILLGDDDLTALSCPGLSLREARLHGTRLADADLPGLELTDVELRGCDLANARLGPRAGLRRVAIVDCRLTGAGFADCVLRDVTVRDSRVDLASFSGARLERVTFSGVGLAQTDFLQAALDGVRFIDCDLTAVDLRDARLRRCELRGCRLDGLRGVASLRGAALPWPDIVGGAGLWAQALGIAAIDEGGDGPHG